VLCGNLKLVPALSPTHLNGFSENLTQGRGCELSLNDTGTNHLSLTQEEGMRKEDPDLLDMVGHQYQGWCFRLSSPALHKTEETLAGDRVESGARLIQYQ
jgi:hypothetical protein